MNRLRRCSVLTALVLVLATACISPKLKLFSDYNEAMKEYTLEGKGKGRVVLIPVRGFLSNEPEHGFLRTGPSPVQEIVAHLDMAAEDKRVKVVVLQIDSPGGAVTASDILFHEIEQFKKRSGAKVVSAVMGLGTSGAYYLALASDKIVAHPTSITGSIGVIFILPKVRGLMDKVGVHALVTKSGPHKDMWSPLRPSTDEEKQLFQDMIDQMYKRFVSLVAKERDMDEARAAKVADGRVFTAEQALALGLIDRVCYLDEALDEAKKLAGLPDDARVVVYRRTKYHNDNRYNTFTGEWGGETPRVTAVDLAPLLRLPPMGFYYLWAPDLTGAYAGPGN